MNESECFIDFQEFIVIKSVEMPLSVHLMPKDVFSRLFVIIGLMFLNYSDALIAANKVLPCDFQDSINIL